jgi:hypothetical protein
VRSYDSTGTALWTYRYTSAGSFNIEEGRDVVVGANNAIYVCGLYQQSGQSLIRGMTFCLCPSQDGVCLLAPTTESVFNTTAITGADLDQDGWRDLIFTFQGQSSLGVYLGSSNGLTFTSSIPLPGIPTLVASADLDQDGDVDVVAGATGQPNLWVLTNTNGTLTYSNLLSSSSQAITALHIDDLDGLSGPDIVATTGAGSGLIVLLNNGVGSFTPSFPTGGPAPVYIATGDLDANGTVDLLIGDNTADSIYVLAGNGSGGFGPPVGYFITFIAGVGVGVEDMNFDGIADMVAVTGNYWCLLAGLGNGNFAPPLFGTIGLINNFVIAPFPQDTSFRLLAGNINSTRKVGFSDCSFTYNATTLASAPGTHLVDVADWTNDGSLDILSYSTIGDVRIWRNCDTLGVITAAPEFLQVMAGQALTVFPSPTSAQTTVLRPSEATGVAEISLWTLRGERVQRWISSAPMVELDLGDRAEGVYLVRYSTTKATWTTRLVIVRGE